MHGWSKFSFNVGITAATMGYGLSGTALGETPVTQLPRAGKDAAVQAWRGLWRKKSPTNTPAYYLENGKLYAEIPYDATRATGRAPINLKEQLAMESVQANPSLGKPIKNITMKDPRWPATEGWVKMKAKVNGVEVHFIQQKPTGITTDFKIK